MTPAQQVRKYLIWKQKQELLKAQAIIFLKEVANDNPGNN
jgi:hypothetical protein